MSQLIHLYASKKGSRFRLAHEILVLIPRVDVEVSSRIRGLNCGLSPDPEVINIEFILRSK